MNNVIITHDVSSNDVNIGYSNDCAELRSGFKLGDVQKEILLLTAIAVHIIMDGFLLFL